jgi:hypothetical protein
MTPGLSLEQLSRNYGPGVVVIVEMKETTFIGPVHPYTRKTEKVPGR